MVAHFTLRTYGVNKAFRFGKAFGYIERIVKSDVFLRERPSLHHTCELPSVISTMGILQYNIMDLISMTIS